MKNVKDITVSSRIFNALDSTLRQPYIKALENVIAEGYDVRQILATDVTKTDFSVSAVA